MIFLKNQEREKNYINIKITVLGKTLVGKTSLTNRYINYNQPDDHDPTLTRIQKFTRINDKNYEIEIFDADGDEDYQNMLDMWISFGNGFLLVFAINDKSSFDYIPSKIERIIKKKHDKEFPMILVGNKLDLADNREVSYDEAKKLADFWNIDYIETSTTTNYNCDEIFDHLTEKIYEFRSKTKRSKCPCSIY